MITINRRLTVSGIALLAAAALVAAACAAEDTATQDAAAAASSDAASAASEASAAMAAAQGAQAGADAADAKAASAQADAASATAAADAAAAAAAEAQAAAALAQATASGSADAIAEAETALADAQAAAEAASAQAAAAQAEAAAAQAEAAAAQAEAAAAQAEAAAAVAQLEEMGAAALEEFMNPGAGVSVTQARADWTTGYMQAAIYHHLLEELGYDVNDPSDYEIGPQAFYIALAQGEYDFWVNGWFPLQDQWLLAELPDSSIVGDHVSQVGQEMLAGGLQGFLTNKSIVDEYGIKTLDQINNDPELVALYDSSDSIPGDGKVQIFGCQESWTCDDHIDETIIIAEWDNIEQIKAGYSAMVADAVGLEAEGKPFITYTWTPSAYVTLLTPGGNAMWLAIEESSVNDGRITPAFDNTGPPAAIGPDRCTNDPCFLGFIAADILAVANNDFLAANPAARVLLENIKISVIDVALQNVKYDSGEDSTGDVNRHASEWIAANRDKVDEWLQTAREAAA